MDRGKVNDQISKTLGISESTIGYYREKPNNLIGKRASKLLINFQALIINNKDIKIYGLGLNFLS